VFVVPVNYRPPLSRVIQVPAQAIGPVQVVINNDGSVVINTSGTYTQNQTWVSFDSQSWETT